MLKDRTIQTILEYAERGDYEKKEANAKLALLCDELLAAKYYWRDSKEENRNVA